MATPLSLYVPIKQDPITQLEAKAACDGLVERLKPGLDKAQIVHYARLVLIPNASGGGIQAVLLITTFDGPMNPYLKFFWDTPGFRDTFQGFAKLALNPPEPLVEDLTTFENFINSNNLSQPADLYQAYPQTVPKIIQAFKPKQKPA
jgi:hypothetical protein